jgi:hypothetical protein
VFLETYVIHSREGRSSVPDIDEGISYFVAVCRGRDETNESTSASRDVGA